MASPICRPLNPDHYAPAFAHQSSLVTIDAPTVQGNSLGFRSLPDGDDGQHLRHTPVLIRAAAIARKSGGRLLPDARLLADAGTGRLSWNDGVLSAALNLAAFVSPGCAPENSLALAALADCAALAVHTPDNAALLAGITTPLPVACAVRSRRSGMAGSPTAGRAARARCAELAQTANPKQRDNQDAPCAAAVQVSHPAGTIRPRSRSTNQYKHRNDRQLRQRIQAGAVEQLRGLAVGV